jgi:hypothetical protein
VVAIKLGQGDPRNYSGPPYSIEEIVFDEYDFGGCSLDVKEFVSRGRLGRGDETQHPSFNPTCGSEIRSISAQ